MKIDFERTGGFMGLRMVASFTTEELPEEEAETLVSLLEEVRFFELPAHLTSPTPGMDQFHYVLTVTRDPEIRREHDDDEDGFSLWRRPDDDDEEEAPASHTVEFTDAAAPLEMLPLIRMLTRLARGQ